MTSQSSSSQGRLGFFGGVFTPSVLTILGVIMYLRTGWVVGQVGLGGTILIVLLAHLISIATGLSIASIATNRTVKTGGAYYMISRSLGASAGTAIGIPLFFAQALSVTFYIVGFTESLSVIYPNLNARFISTLVLVVLTLISLRSSDLAIRAQYIIMVAIGASLLSFFVGHGGSSAVSSPASIEWWHSSGQPFSQVFAVFFPAVTGVMAGVSMSGDLKNPRQAIPLGTMMAIGVGLVLYLAIPILLATRAPMGQLASDKYIMWKISWFPQLIFVGVWGATLSSAVGSILGAPRTLQALAIDQLAPRRFAKGYGPTSEPRAGLLLTFVIAQVGILIGSLDLIAPILTMFFLATYGVTNLACGLERWANSPSFRPTFHLPTWVSMFGAFACFYVMSLINLPAMLGALAICALLFTLTQRRELHARWGDATHGIWSALLRWALLRLDRTDYHPINWRPNMLILGGNPDKRGYLLEVGSMIAQQSGVASYFHLLSGKVEKHAERRKHLTQILEKKLAEQYPNVFYRVEIVDNTYTGAVSVAQSYGVGRFEANTVLLGWPNHSEPSEDFVQMLRDLLALERSLLLLNFKEEKGFGQYKEIHIWWGGLRGNGGLILLLAYLLRNDPQWHNATIKLFVVIDSKEAQAKVQVKASFQKVLEDVRLQGEARIIVRNGQSIDSIMRENSSQADLAIIGLRAPDTDTAADDFFARSNMILEALPSTMMVCSARTFEIEPVLFDQ